MKTANVSTQRDPLVQSLAMPSAVLEAHCQTEGLLNWTVFTRNCEITSGILDLNKMIVTMLRVM